MKSDDVDIDFHEEDEGEYVFDEVNGSKGKKAIISFLNRRKLGKYEMDEIFCDYN